MTPRHAPLKFPPPKYSTGGLDCETPEIKDLDGTLYFPELWAPIQIPGLALIRCKNERKSAARQPSKQQSAL